MNIRSLSAAMLLIGLSTGVAAPGHSHDEIFASTDYPGLIVLAEYRFDPLVQRIMAERALKALPLRNGQLFYLYPIGADPRLEEMQIRYLEVLLDKRAAAQSIEPAGE
ncbi:MAG: hypothetical protein R3E82_13775 [Pseudomonadales bacterium]|nr:hypothetical protein [Pseudomonadales bacterium]